MHKNTKSSPRFDNSVAAAAASHVTHVMLLFRQSMIERCSGAVPVCSDTLQISALLWLPCPAPAIRLYKLLWWWEDQSRANSFRVFTFFRICIGCDLRRCRCPEQICENVQDMPTLKAPGIQTISFCRFDIPTLPKISTSKTRIWMVQFAQCQAKQPSALKATL